MKHPANNTRSKAVRRTRAARQLGFHFRTWGGARKGAGRPPSGAAAGVSHLARSTLSRNHPVHVTLKISKGIPTLRGSALFRNVRGALARGKEKAGFRLVHFSVQRDHLHLIVEASGRRALGRGAAGLARAASGRGAPRRTGRMAAACTGTSRRCQARMADRRLARSRSPFRSRTSNEERATRRESFTARPRGIYPHALFGGIALAVGSFQYRRKPLARRRALHRNVGKVYVIAALLCGRC